MAKSKNGAEMTTEAKQAAAEKAMTPSKRISFQVSEAYKMIRTNLLFTLSTSDKRTVVFSSAEPSAGKSTLSANLAIVMAQTGAHVVLVDADMRKPTQHRNFKLSRTMGLSKVLSGQNKLDECVCKEVKANLDVIPAGTIPPNPSELLGSHRMDELIAELESRYDYVLIDMPPIGIVTDALVVAPKAAGILLVARHKQTTYDELAETADSVSATSAPLLGVVLTDVEQEQMLGYGRYGRYGKYGRYGRYNRYGKYGRYGSRYYRAYDYAYATDKEKQADKEAENG